MKNGQREALDTKSLYAKVVGRLVAQSGGMKPERDYGVALGRHLTRRVTAGETSWATAKQYASAVRWELRERSLSLDAFEAEWARCQALRKQAKSKRKSSRKVKITTKEIAALEQLAQVREQRSFRMAAALFHASVLLGLRPCEWAGARWADRSKTTLIVQNAKAASTVMKYGPFAGRLWVRGNGSERCLKLTSEGIDAGVRDVVDRVLGHESEYPWRQHRTTIWRSFKRLVKAAREREMIAPKFANLTIYSARHQFAADAKRAMDVGSGEVAAAMGHSAVRTAVSGYGRRNSGGSFAPVARPDLASIKAVQSLVLRRANPRDRLAPSPYPKPSSP